MAASSSVTDRTARAKRTDVVDTRGCPQLLQPAPHFQGTGVQNGAFREIKLADYRGKYLVFFFYPLNFTFVCPTEIIAFSEKSAEFASQNCELLACSCDSHFSHLAFLNTPRKAGGLEHLTFPLLSDVDKTISRNYNVLLEDQGLSLRALFIIDPKGIVRHVTVNDIPVGRSVEETLRLVQAIKYSDDRGQVCPHAWVPGRTAIAPTQEGSATYYAKKYNPISVDKKK